jgi:signal peptidase I
VDPGQQFRGVTGHDSPPERAEAADIERARVEAASGTSQPVSATDSGPSQQVDPEQDATSRSARAKPRHLASTGRVPIPLPGRPDGKGRKPRPGRRRRSAFWKELPLLIVVALILTFLIQTFLGKVYVIPSGSMEVTLHGCTGCVNDRVLVDKVSYRFTSPRPGDVVVFRGPDGWVNTEFTVEQPDNILIRGLQTLGSLIGLAPPDEKDFVKRVIATGGQTVSCCDAQNRVVVDGKPLDEPYVTYPKELGPPRQVPFGPVRVPEGQLWVMGDNRNNSADSREQGHGPVPADLVIGKARWIVLPFSRLGGIPDPNPQTSGAAAAGAPGVEVPAPLALAAFGVLPILMRRRARA